MDEHMTLVDAWINEEKARYILEIERAYRDREFILSQCCQNMSTLFVTNIILILVLNT